MPLVSIIIPVYNVDKYLRTCLDSIINWTFTNWEAILIDDGTPDNSGVICDEYVVKDTRFKVIHKQNEGVSVARNLGLDIAKGEWCWFVDSDDLIDSNTPVDLELLKEKDMVMFDIKMFNDGEAIPYTVETTTYDECDNLDTFYKKWISYTHPTIWYSRKFWDKNGEYAIRFTKGIILGEDLEFMRKCELLATSPIKIHHTNYYYRLREGSAYHNANIHKQAIDDTFKVMNNLCEFMEKNHIVPTAGFLPRFTNLAICIPAHAIAAGVWKRLLQKTFKNIVNKYEEHGINLTSTNYIWLAIKMPWLLALAVKFKSL
ncbi:glycosyl transferase family 2 [Bacteroides sp. CAG:754]|jgi:glycosyltransferase involved in cell wall biosynthesis|nr:glycosyl transferase family 2 [Bacteroides sp. CAG:754]